MKFPSITGLIVATCALASIAQAEIKVAAVNMQDLYKSFYKRINTEKRLNELKIQNEEELRSRAEQLRALGEELNAIRKRKAPSLSPAELKEIEKEFTNKLKEAQAIEQEFVQFRQQLELTFNEMESRETAIIIQDIERAVSEAAAEGKYQLVIDTSAASPPLGTKVYPYVDKTLDITPIVMKKLNASAPASHKPQGK